MWSVVVADTLGLCDWWSSLCSCSSLFHTVKWLLNGIGMFRVFLRFWLTSSVCLVNIESLGKPVSSLLPDELEIGEKPISHPYAFGWHRCLSHAFRWFCWDWFVVEDSCDWLIVLGRAALECWLRPLVDVVVSWSLCLFSVYGSHPVTNSGAVFGLS